MYMCTYKASSINGYSGLWLPKNPRNKKLKVKIQKKILFIGLNVLPFIHGFSINGIIINAKILTNIITIPYVLSKIDLRIP